MELIIFPYESKEQLEQMIQDDPNIAEFSKISLQAPGSMKFAYGIVVNTTDRTVDPIGVTTAQRRQSVSLDSIRMTPEEFHELLVLDIYIERKNNDDTKSKAREYTVYDLLDMGACKERVGALGRTTGKYQWTEEELLDYALNEGEDGDVDWIRSNLREREEETDPVYGILEKYMVTSEQMEELKKNENMTMHTNVGKGDYNVLLPYKGDVFLNDIYQWCDLIDVLKGVDNS